MLFRSPFKGGHAAPLWGVWSADGFQLSAPLTAAESSLAQGHGLPEQSTSRNGARQGRRLGCLDSAILCLVDWLHGAALQFRLLLLPSLQYFLDPFIEISCANHIIYLFKVYSSFLAYSQKCESQF